MNAFKPTTYHVGEQDEAIFTPDVVKLKHLDFEHGGLMGVKPRPEQYAYGSEKAISMGMKPAPYYMSEDDLVPEKDIEKYIAHCHQMKLFPMYHMEDSGLFDDWTQNGLNYCWAWGIACCMMTERLTAGHSPLALAPTSLGWTVNWRNSGGYLGETIQAVTEQGVAPLDSVNDIHSTRPSLFDKDWEEKALENRVLEWADIPCSKNLLQVRYQLTMLGAGKPQYVASNWWSHAYTNMGMDYNPNSRYLADYLCFNSHGDGLIKLTGSRALPDEAYAILTGTLPTG
jgi:hypothetical protein